MIEVTSKKLKEGRGRKLRKWLFKNLLFLTLLFGPVPIIAQIHIGAVGTAETDALPIVGLYDYSYSQQIVLASEYAAADGIAGPITQVKWKILSEFSSSYNWNNWTVYLGHTDKSFFLSETDYVPISTLTQVYSGNVIFEGDNTWVTINIPTSSSFVYNGVDNLVVTVIENVEGWSWWPPTFAAYSNPSTSDRAIFGFQDGDEINLNNLGSTDYKFGTSDLSQIQFTGAMNPCAVPQNLIINPTYNSAVASWDANANADLGFSYELRTSGTQNSGSDGLVLFGTLAPGENSITFQNLTEGTTYSLYLKTNCSTNSSQWGLANVFSTFVVKPSPWFEGFNEAFIPLGWQQNTTSEFDFGIPYNFNIDSPASGNVAFKNIYTPDADLSGLTSVTVGPILAGDKLSFDYKSSMYFTEYNNGADQGAVFPDMGSVDLYLSTNFGDTQTLLSTIEFGESGWQHIEFLLSNYASVGQYVQFKFVVNFIPVDLDGDGFNDTDINFAIDNFYIGSCELPSVPSVIANTLDTVTIVWDAPATDVYEIEYGTFGFVQGQGTVIEVTGSTHVITGLSQATEYQYYVRKKCSNTNFSPKLGRFDFSTACPVFESGFTQNFDTANVGDFNDPTVPVCWSFIDGGSGYGYVVDSSEASSPNQFVMNNNSDESNPYILVSPETNNLGNGNFRVKFKARGGSSGYVLKFGTLSDSSDPATFSLLHEFVLPSTYQSNEFIVYLPSGTNDYFAFKHGQTGGYQNIFIDNVVYEEISVCPEPINLNVEKNLSTLTANLTWQGPENSTNNNFEIEWGEAGFALGTGNTTTSNVLNKVISGLTLGTTYSFYVRRICGNENTEWVGPYIFEMEYCESDFNTYDGEGITAITITGQELPILLEETYQFIENAGITFNVVDEQNIAVTFETGFDTSFKVYIDLNNNGFDANDLYAQGYDTDGNGVTTSIISLPNNGEYFTGSYRVRIISEYGNNITGPCETGNWGQTFDFYADFIFPCVQPTNINFLDVGYEYVELDWQGLGDSDYELEYGPTGFTQGAGIIVTNVSKPYTLQGLTPGTAYEFYVRKNCSGSYSVWSDVVNVYLFCDTPAPTGENDQTLVSDELLSDLVINGQDLKFYLDPNLSQEVPASTALQVSETYFVTQTINCESDSYLIVNVNVIPRIAKPIGLSNQSFCAGGTIGDILVSSLPGATLIWYQTETSTQALSVETPIETGSYYVVQTDGVTTSHRLLVNVVVNVVPENLVPQTIVLCGSYAFANVSVNNLQGTTVKWYASPTSATPIVNTSAISTGTYYVTQSYGICESERVPFQVSQFDTLNKPIAATQSFCGSGTVADLAAEGIVGGQILWYASATSNVVLSPQVALSTGTYYVAQTANGCFSERRAVSVRVISLVAPQISSYNFCGSGTVAELYIPYTTGITYKWYTSPTSTYELPQVTPLGTGVYFVERVQNGCVSQRSAVQVTVGTIPAMPTGPTTQTYLVGATVSDLLINQAGVVWYSSYNDSQNGVNPLAANLPLVNANTYYAVVIGENGCPSLPLAVTVNIYLSNDEFVKDELKYYPNPVEDILNINYSERILQIEVFDLLGKRVKTVNTDNNNVELNLSDLASGTYMIQLKSENKQQFIKVVKK